MKIKVNAILRGSDITADPGQEITVDYAIGKKYVDSGAAEEIEKAEEEKIEEAEEIENKKPIKKKAR